MIKTLYKPFQHWSEKGSIYLVSDTHFDDSDRAFMGYNFSETVQIDRLKIICHKNDTLIHLGDVGNLEYMNQLKCYKVLIMGNHDQSVKKMEQFFNEVYTGPLWISQKIVLSHEPIAISLGTTNEPIAFNIHGHDHSNEYYQDNYHLNICQNIFGYLPLNLKNFIEKGSLNTISSIHRATINYQMEKKYGR